MPRLAAKFASRLVIRHMAAVTQNLKILYPVIVFIAVLVMDLKSRTGTVMPTTLAPTGHLNKTCGSLGRQTMIESMWISLQHLLTLRFSTFWRPVALHPGRVLRPLSPAKMRLWTTRQDAAHFSAMIVRPLIGCLSLLCQGKLLTILLVGSRTLQTHL